MKKKKADPKKMFVRVMCIILCVLLAGGSIASVLMMLIGGFWY